MVRASVTGSVSAAAALPVAAHIALEDADGVDGRAGGEPVFRGSIEFEHVDFAHGASPVLHDVTFRVRAGETLALVGPSGSGKSTIVNLLLRFYDPDAGCVLLDDVDLGTFPRKQVRGAIAVVMQEPFLYSKTLRDNIRFGRPEARVDEIVAAAEAAHVHGSIEAFEAGYETMVGERGVMLSGGQRQRVALARALLDRPAVLVLDDALSAVDTETESLILENLRARQGQQTTILIAHRISTLMHADHILVLEHGRIVERGTHAELVAGRGLYRRLWEIQTNLEDDLARDLETATADQSRSGSGAVAAADQSRSGSGAVAAADQSRSGSGAVAPANRSRSGSGAVAPADQFRSGSGVLRRRISPAAGVARLQRRISPAAGVARLQRRISPAAGVARLQRWISPGAGVARLRRRVSPAAGVVHLHPHRRTDRQ
ncbi:MAG: ATP-binding cassette domain-containing protein [Candidatus Eisenbacteria bacterium]